MALKSSDISEIIIMRGLGYHQREIADKLGISRKTVENHLNKLKEQANEEIQKDNLHAFYLEKVLGNGAISLMRSILKNR